tara:strand:+ start:165 stop:752 length:588 start_codon:yes stop_codon:yes gene_type:complete
MITAIGDVMRECYDRGWITTRDGNCSLRRKNDNKIYITPSGVRKNIIYPESIEKIMIVDGNMRIKENLNPSGELEMHWLLLKNSQKTRCVLHVHPTNIVAAMYAGLSLRKIAADFPEIYRYTSVGPNVPILPATSNKLAISTFKNMSDPEGNIKHDIVGQTNHGACSIGNNPWDAFEHIERLEHICQIALASRKF